MADEEVPLSNNWHGLNRSVAIQNLAPSESPDTTDARSYGDRVGALGPRLGRERVATKSANILGLGLLHAANGIRKRVVCLSDGTWNTETVPWPAKLR